MDFVFLFLAFRPRKNNLSKAFRIWIVCIQHKRSQITSDCFKRLPRKLREGNVFQLCLSVHGGSPCDHHPWCTGPHRTGPLSTTGPCQPAGHISWSRLDTCLSQTCSLQDLTVQHPTTSDDIWWLATYGGKRTVCILLKCFMVSNVFFLFFEAMSLSLFPRCEQGFARRTVGNRSRIVQPDLISPTPSRVYLRSYQSISSSLTVRLRHTVSICVVTSHGGWRNVSSVHVPREILTS